jgi:L-histidine N-alpha-methyltransferase
MDAQFAREQSSTGITLHRLGAQSAWSTLAQDVRTGLTVPRKRLPPKYFYDDQGSLLFERICETPEYYPTSTEYHLLQIVADEVIGRVRPGALIELGSGSSRKTVHLLDACERAGCACTYVPIDVCAEMLLRAGAALCARYPWLDVEACVGDYGVDLGVIPNARGPRLFAFLGGTLGNLEDEEALAFLGHLRAAMTVDDRLLLGADRVKDERVLFAAYNDATGYTAAFNLNMLHVINRELRGEFDLARFTHRAYYNAAEARIEMHIVARVAHSVAIRDLGLRIQFDARESILTEISRKFTPDTLTALLARGGFAIEAHYEPEDSYFSLMLARPS